MSDNDGVAVTLDEIRDRNEQSIAKLKLSDPFLLDRSAYGDVQRLLAALDEVQDLHLPSLTVDGDEVCPRCRWIAGKTVAADQCELKLAIRRGLAPGGRPVPRETGDVNPEDVMGTGEPEAFLDMPRKADPLACSDPPEESCSDAGCPAHGDDVERWES